LNAVKNLRWSHFPLAAAFLVLSVSAASISAAQESKLPKASEVVKPVVFAPVNPVARESVFTVSVSVEIRKEFHIQANKVLEDYLIPTTVEAHLPAGWKLLDTSYPRAKLVRFPFNPKEMAVYEGKIELKLKLQAAASAPLGKLKLPLTLRFQACNDAACLPPVRVPLEAMLEIGPAAKTP
jgi:Disulphide bond corrector protein DsbC